MCSPRLGHGVSANWDGAGDMKFYVVALVSLFMAIFAFVMMSSAKPRPPEPWGDWAYSNSRFARWIERLRKKSRLLGPLRIDKFRMASFVVTTIIFGASAVALVIDFSTGLAVTEFLGTVGLAIAILCVVLPPVLYEAFLTIWWSIVDHVSNRSSEIKRLKSIIKNRNNKKK